MNYGPKNRKGSVPFSSNPSRANQEGAAQIHVARRNDRQKG